MGGACSNYRGEVWCIRVLVGKPEGKRPPGRPRRKLEDNIKMDFQVVGWGAWTGSICVRTGRAGRNL